MTNTPNELTIDALESEPDLISQLQHVPIGVETAKESLFLVEHSSDLNLTRYGKLILKSCVYTLSAIQKETAGNPFVDEASIHVTFHDLLQGAAKSRLKGSTRSKLDAPWLEASQRPLAEEFAKGMSRQYPDIVDNASNLTVHPDFSANQYQRQRSQNNPELSPFGYRHGPGGLWTAIPPSSLRSRYGPVLYGPAEEYPVDDYSQFRQTLVGKTDLNESDTAKSRQTFDEIRSEAFDREGAEEFVVGSPEASYLYLNHFSGSREVLVILARANANGSAYSKADSISIRVLDHQRKELTRMEEKYGYSVDRDGNVRREFQLTPNVATQGYKRPLEYAGPQELGELREFLAKCDLMVPRGPTR